MTNKSTNNSKWLADELAKDSKKSKGVKQRAAIIIIFLLFLSGGAFALVRKPAGDTFEPPETVQQSVVVDEPNTATGTPPASSSTTSTSAPASQSSSPNPSEVNAKLCQDSIKTAQNAAQTYRDQYDSSYNFWKSTYEGQYYSSAAADSRANYIAFTKNQFADYISRNTSTVQTFCKSSASLPQIMLQPDYSAWR